MDERWRDLGRMMRQVFIDGLMFRSCVAIVIYGAVIAAEFAVVSWLAKMP